jgi:serine protease Do
MPQPWFGERILVLPEVPAPASPRRWAYLFFNDQAEAPRGSGSQSSGSYLGLGAMDITNDLVAPLNLESTDGVLVTSITSGSAAQKGGMRVKDIIVGVNGSNVTDIVALKAMLQKISPGTSITVTVLRQQKRVDLSVVTDSRQQYNLAKVAEPRRGSSSNSYRFFMPEIPSVVTLYRNSLLGAELEGLNQQMATFFGVEDGVLIRQIVDSSPAAEAGFRAGDVIVSYNDQKITSPREVSECLRQNRDFKPFQLTVVRDGQKLTKTVRISEKWMDQSMFPQSVTGSTWDKK